MVYLQTTDTSDTKQLGFVLGKAKLAPIREHSIPRLELCAAVLVVEVAQFALEQLDLEIDNVKFYTDSKVVLGYISNETRRFFVCVGNRVERIRKFSTPKQWNYVPTDCNPADSATRTLQAHEMHSSKWLLGPTRSLYCENEETNKELYQLIERDGDQELRPAVKSTKTDTVSEPICDISTHRLERFSDWMRLVRTIAFLKRVARLRGTKSHDLSTNVESYQEAEECVLKCVQSEAFGIEIDLIRQGKPLKGSPIANLNPFLDEHGILRVGGRIINSDLTLREKKPLIVPGRHHIATLLVRRYHSDYHHQGRHITEGVVRAAGFWIIGSKRLVSSSITCRKLRGKTEQ